MNKGARIYDGYLVNISSSLLHVKISPLISDSRVNILMDIHNGSLFIIFHIRWRHATNLGLCGFQEVCFALDFLTLISLIVEFSYRYRFTFLRTFNWYH